MEKTNYNEIPEVDEIALWKRTAKSGLEYFSGVVKCDGQEFKVVAFQNEKTKDTQPDYKFSKNKEIK